MTSPGFLVAAAQRLSQIWQLAVNHRPENPRRSPRTSKSHLGARTLSHSPMERRFFDSGEQKLIRMLCPSGHYLRDRTGQRVSPGLEIYKAQYTRRLVLLYASSVLLNDCSHVPAPWCRRNETTATWFLSLWSLPVTELGGGNSLLNETRISPFRPSTVFSTHNLQGSRVRVWGGCGMWCVYTWCVACMCFFTLRADSSARSHTRMQCTPTVAPWCDAVVTHVPSALPGRGTLTFHTGTHAAVHTGR